MLPELLTFRIREEDSLVRQVRDKYGCGERVCEYAEQIALHREGFYIPNRLLRDLLKANIQH